MITAAGKGTRFRPCIDLHEGEVKQIVGGTLAGDSSCTTNFVSPLPPEHYADLYRRNGLTGGHLIKLGGGNDEAARSALACWRGGLQVGGGITFDNAKQWLADGADKVIVTSWLFPAKEFSLDRLRRLSEEVGREKLVVDVSCRKRDGRWFVAIDKWQTITDMEVNGESLAMIAPYCSEFLIHAADVEGLCRGIDEELVKRLGEWVTIPTTYAGGANNISDLQLVSDLSGGKVDLTFGSSLDIFGGKSVSFEQCVEWNRSLRCSQ